jgi:hypothetical protein
VPLGSYEGLARQSVVNLDVLYTVPVAALSRRVGAVGSAKLAQIDRAIHFALGLDDWPRDLEDLPSRLHVSKRSVTSTRLARIQNLVAQF